MQHIPVKKIIKKLLTREDADKLINEDFINIVDMPIIANKSTYNPTKRGYASQLDITFHPSGERYKAVLCIIDIVSRYFLAFPILNKSAQEVLKGLKYFFEVKNFETTKIYVDGGSEYNNNVVKNYLTSRQIILQQTVPQRHNQLAIIDAYIYIFNKIIVSITVYKEMDDNIEEMETGRPWKRRLSITHNWAEYIKDAVDEMNKYIREDKPLSDFLKPPLIEKNEKIYPLGLKVYKIMDVPYDPANKKLYADNKHKRVGDYRFYPKPDIYTIDFVSLRPNQPIRYLIADKDGKRLNNVSYLQKELKPLTIQ